MNRLLCGFILLISSLNLVAAEQKANFLFIFTDDQSFNTIAAHGNNEIDTPNIDRIAKQGMSFSHVFNQGSWSGAVCAPSRRMLNSGRNLYLTGMGGNYGLGTPSTHERKKAKAESRKLPATAKKVKHPLWGETFRNAGYDTFMSGKWHIDEASWLRSWDYGTAVYMGGMSRPEKGGQWGAKLLNIHGNKQDLKPYIGKKHTSELIADAGIDYLQNRANKSDKPFLMYMAFLAPHDPRQSPDSYVQRYPGEKISLPANYLPEHPFDQGSHKIRDEKLLPFPRSQAAVQDFIGEYYAMISHLDDQVGRLLDALEASGKADNTYIIFTSDHGLAVGQHGLLGKQNQYDHSVRVPFIIAGPNVPVNSQKTGMFYINSIFASTADLAGISVPTSVQAPSIVPLLNSKQDKIFDTVFGSYLTVQRMARDERYKLIFYPEIKRMQLFDLTTDPMEINDLIDSKHHRQIILGLQQKMRANQHNFGDQLPLHFPEI